MSQITSGVGSPVDEIFSRDEQGFLEEWIREIRGASRTSGTIAETDLRQECAKFFREFHQGMAQPGGEKADDPRWKEVRQLLEEISEKRARQGFTSTETATFVF